MIRIILIILVIESVLLLVLAALRKLTRKVFLCMAAVSALVCMVLVFASGRGGAGASAEPDQKAYLYMAARLAQEDHPEESMRAIAFVDDAGNEEYGVIPLRGLLYHLNDAYALAEVYLENTEEDEDAVRIHEASVERREIPAEVKEAVTTRVIGALSLEEDLVARYEQEMEVLFLQDHSSVTEESLEEAQTLSGQEEMLMIRIALLQLDYPQAWERMQAAAAKGGLREDILLSMMYVQGYHLQTLDQDDEALDALLTEMTARQAERDRMALTLRDENGRMQYVDEEGNQTQEAKEYYAYNAQFQLAQADLRAETVRRAIRYLEENAPEEAETVIAYQYQLAYLHFLDRDTDSAKECLDRIFKQESIDTTQFLGIEANLLRESYVLYADEPAGTDFSGIYRQLTNELYGNLFPDYLDNAFEQFLLEYFREMISGLHLSAVDLTAFPEITWTIHSSLDDFEITEDTIRITDTKEVIEEIRIEKEEVSEYSICYVLDISGSMSGQPLLSAKNAIRDSILETADGANVALVSFDSTARVEAALTSSKGVVSGILDALHANGGTNIAAGLQAGAGALENAPGNRIIILLSDGHDASTSAIGAALNEVERVGATVYTIGLAGSNEGYLSNISESSGGAHVNVENAHELSRIYEEISKYMTTIYRITYVTTETEKVNRYVDIRATEGFVRARHRYTTREEKQVMETDLRQSSSYFRQTGAGGEDGR